MNVINKKKAGLAFGAFLGLFHAAWALLVLLGWAQPFMDWIFGLHFIQPPYVIGEFELGTALLLVIATSVLGYVFGWVLACVWNMIHKQSHGG